MPETITKSPIHILLTWAPTVLVSRVGSDNFGVPVQTAPEVLYTRIEVSDEVFVGVAERQDRAVCAESKGVAHELAAYIREVYVSQIEVAINAALDAARAAAL